MHNELPYTRIMIKISGEFLKGDQQLGISSEAAREVALRLKSIHDLDIQVAVVVGGGNIFRGLSASQQGFDRATADYMGMLATVMNALALQDALEKIEVDTRVQSALSMNQVAEPFIRRRAMRHMDKGRLVIIAAGTGNPFVSTDTGAALHALELHCQVLVKATKVDGIFEADPFENPQARQFSTLRFQDALTMPEVKVLDKAALTLCMENNLPLRIVNFYNQQAVLDAVSGKEAGTLVSNDVVTEIIK